MDEQKLLASLDANLQDQDVYDNQVIQEASLQLAPILTGVGFPSLEELTSTSTHRQNKKEKVVAVQALKNVLKQTQQELSNIQVHDDDPDKDRRNLLLLKQHMLLHHLSTFGDIAEADLPKKLNSHQSASSVNNASNGRVLHKRVPIMKRKRIATEDDDNGEDDVMKQDKEELKRLREDRLKRRAQRRKEWSSSSSSQSESEDEQEFQGELDVDESTAWVEPQTPSSKTVNCPLCEEIISSNDENALDQALAQHMDRCQRQGRSSRRSTRLRSTVVDRTDVEVTNPVKSRHKSKKPRRRSSSRRESVLSSAIDDFQESAYEDRVDDWIEHGLEQMKVMKERDMLEELPGAEFFNGLHFPAWMNDRLFGYQREALRWMWDLHREEVGGILGDEMGLGKTVQVCAYLGALALSRKLRSALVVAPATMLRHWLTELSSWAPGLRRILIHQSGDEDGDTRTISTSMLTQLARWLKQSRADRLYEAIDEHDLETMPPHSFCGTGYVVVTTYENLRRNADIYTLHPWSYVVLDEAQKIRNPDADVTLACKRLRTPHRIAMSGTPIQNSLRELWSLFDFVFPGRLGTLPTFEQEFADPIRRGGYSNASPMQVQLAYRCSLTLKDLIDPYLLRRRKKEIKEVARMPAKTEHVLFCRLSQRQRMMYEAYLDSDDVRRVIRGSGQLLAAVTMLRKICNHPDLVIDPDQASLDSFIKSGSASMADDSHNVSDFDENLEADESLMERSGKLEVLSKILPLWHKQGHRCLIFCQWTKMLNIIQRFMMLKGWKFARLDGKTNVASRQRIVDSFNTDDTYFCLLCTTRTGGVGLNLTGANRIILYDPDFNPQTDAQARERAWRFGQEREVTVYRLISAGTVEEKIYHRQIFKTALSNSVLQDPRQRRLFSQRDLKDLFTLKADGGSIRSGGDGLTDTAAATRGVGVVDETPADTSKDDEETLRKVMKSKGLAGVFDHSFVEQDPRRKSITQREMEEQAKEAARMAVLALHQSIPDDNRGYLPTWTGSQETASTSRFGSSKAPPTSSSNAKGPLNGSMGLLASLRQRQNAIESSVLKASPSAESKEHACVLKQIREFVRRRRPSTDDLLEQFEGSPGFDLATFRQLLKSVATVKNGTWRLK